MSDRTSAAIFGEMFALLDESLASAPGRIVVELAARVWEMTWEYDFAPQQLECDPEALVRLGLARRGDDPPFDYADRHGKLP